MSETPQIPARCVRCGTHRGRLVWVDEIGEWLCQADYEAWKTED